MRPSLTSFIVLTLCILPFGLLTPILEIGPTHVFNPEWPGHARLHEVWQLITHCGIAVLCLWLGWYKNNVRLAAVIALLVSGGFLAAFALSSSYGGTMQHSDGTEILVGGINVAVGLMVVTAIGLVGLLIVTPKQR